MPRRRRATHRQPTDRPVQRASAEPAGPTSHHHARTTAAADRAPLALHTRSERRSVSVGWSGSGSRARARSSSPFFSATHFLRRGACVADQSRDDLDRRGALLGLLARRGRAAPGCGCGSLSLSAYPSLGCGSSRAASRPAYPSLLASLPCLHSLASRSVVASRPSSPLLLHSASWQPPRPPWAPRPRLAWPRHPLL